jgi:putative methyltransferase (TIGR04325 family)
MASVTDSILRSRAVREMVDRLEQKLPPLRAWHRFEYQQHFAAAGNHERMFSGIYETAQAALRAVPAGRLVSYDQDAAADRHLGEIGQIWPSDYPILYWITTLMREGVSIFDLGGNLGIQYYNFKRYLHCPARWIWRVCDLPAIVRRGVELAKIRPSGGLSFTTEFDDANGMDILLASGVVQFLGDPLWESLAKLKVKPRHLLVNRTPLCDGPGFVTLGNIGPAICAYRIWNRNTFFDSLCGLGYQLKDAWTVPDFSCYIPFHPDRSIKAYSGAYLHLSN